MTHMAHVATSSTVHFATVLRSTTRSNTTAMKWQRAPLVLTLVLLFVASTTVNAVSQGEKTERFKLWCKERLKASKADNKRYEAGSCWRKAGMLESGKCADGFQNKYGLLCTASCPLKTPVKCGPICLPQGRSCLYEAAKKTSVIGLFFMKVHKAGFFGMDKLVDSCLDKLKRRDVTKPATLRRQLQTVDECFSSVQTAIGMTEDDFAEVVAEVFPQTTSRMLAPQVFKAENCGMVIYDAVKGLVGAWTKSKEKGATSKEALFADVEEGNKVMQALNTCLDGPAEVKKMGAVIEGLIKSAIDAAKDGKSPDEIYADTGLRLLSKLDMFGVTAIVHEYTQGFCEDAVLKDTNLDQVLENAAVKTTLGLNGLGFVTATEGRWDPNDPAKSLELVIHNTLEHNIKVNLYSGGRPFRENNEKKRLTILKGDSLTTTVPLSEVSDRTIYADVLIDRTTYDTIEDAGKQLVNSIWEALSFGKFKELVTTKDIKLGSLVVWVPGASSGFTKTTGKLYVKGELSKPPPPPATSAPAPSP